MVEKCLIETSVHLRRHKLNNPAEVRIDDDDDVEVLENRFSCDNCIFNATFHGESTPSFMDRTRTFLPSFDMDNSILGDGTDKEVLKNSYDNCIFNAAFCREEEYHEINVDRADMNNSKLESNLDGKKETGNTKTKTASIMKGVRRSRVRSNNQKILSSDEIT
ncbi:hypothetical protein GUJ93_ZPchr0007g4125 [Zizania palustris]|uniref:Uncharacterized protein n=1 Tax=Zizania palustris TaxID=103762 RepID=A0A8J5SUX7_ZIZPA|nr:hypothetical protein GUJ93_ZPchr0007g4125 [Zizania palustris]